MIKQTQTKMFDFSDVGLDFCSGSKNKFPEVFKKMLVTGYNPQIASSVSISGDQITLTYGVTHGYKANRVIQVTASGGFNKQVYVDSITSNTVTCTVLDADTSGLTGTISTKVAALGWTIEYEVSNIHIYKFKHIDESDMYLRVCFQNVAANRSAVNVCVGKTIDAALGTITDSNALQRTKALTSPSEGSGTWEFGGISSSENNFTYSQGYTNYGRGMVIGSPYHLIFLSHTYYTGGNTTDADRVINGIIPLVGLDYSALAYPCILGFLNSGAMTNYVISANLASKSRGWIGNQDVYFHYDSSQRDYGFYESKSNRSSFVPSVIDGFNTTVAAPILVASYSTSQVFGFLMGINKVGYGSTNYPSQTKANIPKLSLDVSNTTYLIEHSIGWSSSDQFLAFALPLEEIKIGY